MTPEEHAAAQAAQAADGAGSLPSDGADGGSAGPDASGEPEAPSKPARKRSPRKKKVAEESDASAPPEATDAPEVTDGPGATPADPVAPSDAEPAPKKRRASGSRSRKKADNDATAATDAATGTGTATGTADQPDAVATTEASTEAPTEAPKRARRSRRAGAAAGAPAPAPTLDVFAAFGVEPDEGEGEQEPAEELARVDIDLPERDRHTGVGIETDAEDEDAEDEDSGSEDDDTEDDTDDGSPRLPATALLFQAPDVARRSRRAAAPAGPPERSVAAEERPASRRRKAEEPEAVPAAGADETGSEQPDEADTTDTTDESGAPNRRRRRRGGRGRRRPANSGSGDDGAGDESEGEEPEANGTEGNGPKGNGAEAATDVDAEDDTAQDSEPAEDSDGGDGSEGGSRRRRRRRSRGGSGSSGGGSRSDDGARAARDEVTALKGSTRLEAKRQRRRDGRDSNRRRSIITEAEFLARRESVERAMVVRERDGRTQIAVLEDNVLVEHYVARKTQTSMVGNVYLGRVQNVLPSMEAAFIDLGKGRNAVLYAGEVNWDAAGLEGQPRRIEQALSSGDSVLVQVTKDPIGHKGARLTSQITLAGRYLVLVPSGAMTGISRKLPDTERARLKKLLKEIVPDGQGVIVRTAAEGASEQELRNDVERLTKQWADIQAKTGRKSVSAPVLLKGEPELATRVVRDVFNEDFASLTVSGEEAWSTISEYVASVAPDLEPRLTHWVESKDVFAAHRIDEQLAKGMDRKVYLPSGGSLVIDRTEAMTVVDVNTGKFTGSGGTLEETVTRNNLEAAEEVVRQLRLRDIGGIIVIDFIDMVLEANRDLVLRRLTECLGRDRTRHQVAEVTSLGLVQMTRKRVGQGLVEAFSETCEHCNGRGFIVHSDPVENDGPTEPEAEETRGGRRRGNRRSGGDSRQSASAAQVPAPEAEVDPEQRAAVRATLATIAAAAAHAHEHEHGVDAPVGAHAPGAGIATGESPAAAGSSEAAIADPGAAATGSASIDAADPADSANASGGASVGLLPRLPIPDRSVAERLDALARGIGRDSSDSAQFEAAAAEVASVDGALLGDGSDEPVQVRLVEGSYEALAAPSNLARSGDAPVVQTPVEATDDAAFQAQQPSEVAGTEPTEAGGNNRQPDANDAEADGSGSA
ncbi:Rne/Rng family ribonuclease [Occultella glacieicola]|uniref:Rne/Rng family ribonuclease n=2 Tax=Occultella glacieicola TaxID=2518684 RepID=A0ABY2E3Y1_9MICO|nr:Rne/Rng family ribonuclease [Occultella glacieicola]